jgi:pimeloyl-ACP methyl ester carboxylesterase/DNA-binding CsgD family transcriptional regulator
MHHPETRYARNGATHIAYQVIGDGPIDLVFVQGFLSNLEVQWEDAGLNHLFNRLGGFARLILFDRRGSGLSDRVSEMPNLETRMDDVRAVLDAVGSEQAVLMGASEGGPMSILFAATHRHRVRALVLYGAYAHFHSWVQSPAQVDAFIAAVDSTWGTGQSLKAFAPSMVANERFRNWWARFERLGTSPAGAVDLARMNSQIDVRGILPQVRVPTLVIHRARDARVNVDAGRYLAAHIAGARYVEVPGVDHPVWVGDTDRVVDEVEEFLTGVRPVPHPELVLATVVRAELAFPRRHAPGSGLPWLHRVRQFYNDIETIKLRFRAREAGRHPGGIAMAFDGPVRALRCALAMREAAAQHDMSLRIGVCIGEVAMTAQEVGGVAVHIASQIAAFARTGEILVSATIRDLVPGAGLRFTQAHDRLPPSRTDLPRLLILEPEDTRAPERRREPCDLTRLSPREREVLDHVSDGLTNAQIAARFNLSEHTIKRHVASILTKLELANRSAAAAFAIGHRLP